MSQYFKNIKESISTLLGGLKITLGYFFDARKSRKPYGIADNAYFDQPDGLMTLQYPHEMMPVPDNGRYRLHNEIDDCIVCDKCAKICPVDCIEIDAVRAVDTFGTTSDGTPKRIYAAKFDIDMSKCCFCGLCTTVCPTECLTMTKTFDFSEEDVENHIYSFGEMSLVEIAQKRKEFEDYQQQKLAAKEETADPEEKEQVSVKPKPKPKPVLPGAKASQAKPKFRPKPMIKKKPKDD